MSFVFVVLLLAVYILAMRFVSNAIQRMGESKSVNAYRVTYIKKTFGISLTVLFVILLFLLLGIQYTQLSLFLSSVFAVIGVALFAQWSMLSNVTASLIIFFAFPYRVGDVIKVVDKDDDISGLIEEISLFHVIISKNGVVITYPNSLMLQKAVIKMRDMEHLRAYQADVATAAASQSAAEISPSV